MHHLTHYLPYYLYHYRPAWYWKYLLGVAPLSPGFERVQVAPHIVTTAAGGADAAAESSSSPLLVSAAGTLNTVRGDVSVSWLVILGSGDCSTGNCPTGNRVVAVGRAAVSAPSTAIVLNVTIPVGIAGGTIVLPGIISDGGAGAQSTVVTLGGAIIWQDSALCPAAAKAHGVAGAVYDRSTASLALDVPASGVYALRWAAPK
jgi:hypothetical protein